MSVLCCPVNFSRSPAWFWRVLGCRRLFAEYFILTPAPTLQTRFENCARKPATVSPALEYGGEDIQNPMGAALALFFIYSLWLLGFGLRPLPNLRLHHRWFGGCAQEKHWPSFLLVGDCFAHCVRSQGIGIVVSYPCCCEKGVGLAWPPLIFCVLPVRFCWVSGFALCLTCRLPAGFNLNPYALRMISGAVFIFGLYNLARRALKVGGLVRNVLDLKYIN